MVVGEASIHNIMGGMESTGGVRLHNHKRKLKQRFDIIKKLGQGTYGKVQLGINKETGQEVAIKTIKKCKIETEADLVRIRREIQIMSSVQHPNIIHIYEVFENREKMVLVMEYAAGGELYDYLSERKVLSEQEARRIFRQIATAVFYCHKHKICHRDLKLENILLDQAGNAKIADFGLSNVFDEQRLLSTFCGSPLYASPEIVKGTPYHGPEVDCWSLGVLLYTLVYGAMPFDGSNFKRLVKQISQSDYFEPKKPSPASPLIKEMLTVCPGRRADIERICTHWWVNEGYEQNCLDIAEDLAAQTPVRLDLLLSLVPQSASAEKLLVGDQQAGGDVANSMSSETLVPTRCHSVGSLMELDQNSSDRRIRELFEEEPRPSASGDAKRKLETTPSMDETTAAGVKRKERSRRKEKSDERESRTYRSSSRHHSAPIPNPPISEEAMEVESASSVPTSKTAEIDKTEGVAACLELIEESKEKSPSKERSKTPLANECERSREHPAPINESIQRSCETDQRENNKEDRCTKSPGKSSYEVEDAALKSASKVANETMSGAKSDTAESKVPNESDKSVRNETCAPSQDAQQQQQQQQSEPTESDFKKLKEKALSFDSELSNEAASAPAKPVERRRSKIFETAEKFNQLASPVESEKPKKIFIPGVNVGGAKRAFERKASLSSATTPPPVKVSASKVIIDVPTDRKSDRDELKQAAGGQEIAASEDKSDKRDEAKKRAVDIISGAIGKPPMQRKLNGSPPISPQSSDSKKLGLKIQVAPNDVRPATVSVSTPVDTRFAFDAKSAAPEATITSTVDAAAGTAENSQSEEPKMSSKMEITLKSATLPRRKTTKAEITLTGVKPSPETVAFKSEVEAKIDAFHPQKLRTQRSEVAFPVAAAVPHASRSSSLEPEGRPKAAPRERIIPIQVEAGIEPKQHSSTPPPKPPMSQRSMSQRSGSLSRQSTADSDTDSALGSTVGPEPIRKSPREYIIPIAVEGGGYVTPRSGSLEPESKTSTPTSTNPPRSRFGRPRRMSSFLSDASEDESPFSSLHGEDLLQRHMHRLRSSRPSRQPSEHADSLSSGEDDDDDGFELLTAENLFSTLLSRVRSLTQRLNVDDNRPGGFPSSRLFGRLSSQPSQGPFWGLNKPLSRRLSESQFKHSLSRDTDMFSKRDSASTSNPGTPSSPGSRSTPSRESVFEIGSNTLPRDKVDEVREKAGVEAETAAQIGRESLEQSFTPSLARRLSRQFIEQTRQSLPRSPSTSRDTSRYSYQSPTRETLSLGELAKLHSASDQSEYRGRSLDRGIRRANSLLEASSRLDRADVRSPRRSISLFDDDDDDDVDDRLLPPLRHIMTLGRKYKEPGRSGVAARRENFYGYSYRQQDKIQEEPGDDACLSSGCREDSIVENGSMSESASLSVCNSNANLMDTTTTTSTSVSANRSDETTPTEESSSNLGDYGGARCSNGAGSFESRLLAAENLIKESKLKNLTPQRFNPNLSCNYKDTDKCDKEALITADPAAGGKRRSCIPSLRLRSISLTREPGASADRRKSFAGTQDAPIGGGGGGAKDQERSILSKFFRGSGGGSKESESKDSQNKSQKPKQHRISRFLRPDFFDTPREESQYVKEKEAQKAAENERRKSRFMRRKSESRAERKEDEKICKEQKNEMNALQKDKLDSASAVATSSSPSSDAKNEERIERQGSKSSFLHSLEKKLERLRAGDSETTTSVAKATMNGTANERKEHPSRECSAPPVECPASEPSGPIEVKRTLSEESVPLLKNKKDAKSAPAKSRVTSMLGLFRTSTDAKQNGNGRNAQSAIMSKLKRSPPKSAAKSVVEEEDQTVTSRIPTKFARGDGKSTRKTPEGGKRSPEKAASECKRSPPKEKSKEPIVKDRKPSMERQSRDVKRAEKVAQSDSSTSSSDKTRLERAEPPRKLSDESEPKVVDNKHAESIVSSEDKKLMKTKKNISSLSGNESVARIDKGEDDKKTRKPVKPKETANEADGAKKKKIVRVVKRVVKKSSDSSESKSDEKEKASKPLLKKRIVIAKKEKSPPEGAQISTRASNPDDRSAEKTDAAKQMELNAPSAKLGDAEEPARNSRTDVAGCREANAPGCNKQQQPVIEQQRPSRAGLKLDLSKIPQHTFRHATPKRDSPKSGSPRTESDKLMECLSKMTYHANISGNKIIIDKPLRAKDIAELKREFAECARIMENHTEPRQESTPPRNDEIVNSIVESKEDEKPKEITPEPRKETTPVPRKEITPVPRKEITPEPRKEITPEPRKEITPELRKEINASSYARHSPEANEVAKEVAKPEPPEDCVSELLSPEEPESFDSWSICSADLNHNRGDLHSPTSPSYYLFARGDISESVIDRIRRRSFYSRFNDRKRPSLTAPPPGVSSVTLPRRYSLNSARERDRSRLYSYGVHRTRSDKNYQSLLGDEVSCRKSPVDRERSSYGHHSPEARSLYDHYGNSVPSSSHDSLRRYVKSPTLDLAGTRAKYHSADIIADNDLTVSYKSPLSRSSLNDTATDSYCGRIASASTLPKKYGSTVGGLAPKSVEYYEEILSPSNSDYLSPRDTCRSPLLDGYLNRCENGYHHNGNLDVQFGTDKQRFYADAEHSEGHSRLLSEQKRFNDLIDLLHKEFVPFRTMVPRFNETRDISSTAADILSNISVAEQN